MMKHPAQSRSRARRYAMQALYQWDLSGLAPEEIRRQFLEEEDFSAADGGYFTALLEEVPQHVQRIDAALSEAADRPIGRVDPVERAILRLAGYELLFREDIPCRVTINEAVALTRKFGADQGYTFVNGVLDRLARKVRPAEFPAADAQPAGG